jgi:hypothetical protein
MILNIKQRYVNVRTDYSQYIESAKTDVHVYVCVYRCVCVCVCVYIYIYKLKEGRKDVEGKGRMQFYKVWRSGMRKKRNIFS